MNVPSAQRSGAPVPGKVPSPDPKASSGWRGYVVMAVYHTVFVIVFLVYAPVLVWRMIWNPSYRRGIAERMGRVPRSAPGRRVVWIHGVSVGEVKAAGTLLRELRRAHPELELVLSSTTPTGHRQASERHGDLRVIYYPLDFGAFPARALRRISPCCVLLVELEIWPNFLRAAQKRGIPVAVVNGRMSEKSFRGYRLVRGFLPQLTLIDRFCVQDRAYAHRLSALGVAADRIHVTGNLKYDGVLLKDPPQQSLRLRPWLSPDGRLVVVCGSTHGDEEVRLAAAVRAVATRIGKPLRLVLAPRHPERVPGLLEKLGPLASGTGMQACVPWSRVSDLAPGSLPPEAILVVDTIGHLESFYGACDIAFVGGSLVPHGGQNMLEPAALGKPVVFGPHTGNFKTDVRLLLQANAAVVVQDEVDLVERLVALCEDGEMRAELGRRAVEVIRSNQGATKRTLELLEPLLAPRPLR